MKFFTEKPQTPSKQKVLDIKTLLKLARQYIDDNNIKKAQQCCKKVLRKNSQNYIALVLLGKSYGKSDDAPLAYENAIDLKPDHPLAWQGLAHYYEAKEGEWAKTKLLNIYDKILTLNIEEDYAYKVLKKHGHLGCLLKNSDTISSFIQYIRVQSNEKLIHTAKTQLLQLLESKITCKDKDLPDAINILKNLSNKDLCDDKPYLILLGNLILQNNDFMNAVEEIIQLELFPRSLMMKEWLCKILSYTYITQNSFLGFDIDKYINKLIMGIQHTRYGSILTAIMYYRRTMFEEAYQKCVSVIKDNFDFVEETEALFLLNCSKMSSNLIRTENLCYYFLRNDNLNKPAFIKALDTVLLSCFIGKKDFYKSLYCLIKTPIDQIDSNVLTELGNLYLEMDVNDDVTWEILNSTDYFDLFKAFSSIKSRKFSEAIEILLPYDKHAIKYYYLGLAYWFINLDDESLESFQKAAEHIPNHPKICYCLGLHYYLRKDDIEESKKLFEKSYALCKTDINVVKMLSFIYVRQGLMDLDLDLLQTAFDIPQTREFWICAKLGHICYTRGIMDEALIYLQAAINIHPQDATVQELVGEIYFNKKDYDQALTAYNKVIELSRDSVIFFKCLNRIGFIYSEQMLYHKAVYVFDTILDSDPSNVAALKGITENRIICALKHVANDLFQDAREQMQRAINRISTAMSMGIKDLVYWVLYADVLVFMTRLPNEYSFVNIQNSEGETRKEKIDMYEMAIESYSNIIKFRDSSALFKCALAYFEYFCETKNIVFCKTSYNLAVLYMKVNPNVWPIWDMLGKISYHLHKFETAYYCFTTALCLCEDSEFKIWWDLALFYLKLDKHQLATYRHVIARFDLSTFAPAWVKEDVTDTISNHNDNSEITDPLNVDKFGFKEWIRTYNPSSAQPSEPTFDSPMESLKIVPNGSEIIEWYLCLEEETAWSCCSLGNLQESKGLFVSALRYYDRAYAIAHDILKNEILSRKGRVLMKMQEYEEAINVYKEVREKNLEDTCALAQALHKIENYKKSYNLYDKALNNLCENDNQRVDILITMSNIVYRLNGVRDGAILLLRAAKIKRGEGQYFSLPFLKTYVFKKVDIQLVAYVMTEYLYNHIDKATWWYYMGLNYLRGIKKYAKITRVCIKRAICVNTEPRRNGKLQALRCIAEFYAGNRQKALNYATRALNSYSLQPELWAVFILCIYYDKTWPHKASFLRVVIDTVRRLINVSECMDKWFTKLEEEMIGAPKKFDFTLARNSISP